MASHADRLKQSSCFKNAEMTCISCHDPHKSVTSLDNNHFNNKCVSCHSNCEETPKGLVCELSDYSFESEEYRSRK